MTSRSAAWRRKSENSVKEYVSLSVEAPEFGPKKLYANLGRAAGQDDEDVYAVIRNRVSQTGICEKKASRNDARGYLEN